MKPNKNVFMKYTEITNIIFLQLRDGNEHLSACQLFVMQNNESYYLNTVLQLMRFSFADTRLAMGWSVLIRSRVVS